MVKLEQALHSPKMNWIANPGYSCSKQSWRKAGSKFLKICYPLPLRETSGWLWCVSAEQKMQTGSKTCFSILNEYAQKNRLTCPPRMKGATTWPFPQGFQAPLSKYCCQNKWFQKALAESVELVKLIVDQQFLVGFWGLLSASQFWFGKTPNQNSPAQSKCGKCKNFWAILHLHVSNCKQTMVELRDLS